jgi:hypothetical protein
MRRTVAAILVTTLVLVPSMAAQEGALKVANDDSIDSVLETQVGQRVTVTLASGTEITGIVRSVGEEVVHLSELSGKEFYDAVVSLDEIAAVTIRVRGK